MKTIFLQIGAGEIASTLFVLLICFLIFLAIRAIMLWYWKIDTIVENQEKQLSALKAILNKLTPHDQLNTEDKAKAFDAIEAAKHREHSKI